MLPMKEIRTFGRSYSIMHSGNVPYPKIPPDKWGSLKQRKQQLQQQQTHYMVALLAKGIQ